MSHSWIGRSNRSSRAPRRAAVQNSVRLELEDLEVRQVLSNSANPYVIAVYQAVLHRAPDAQGLANWSNLLDSGQVTRIQVAYAIQNSVEGQNILINELYQQILNRPADPTGLDFWRGILNANNNADYNENNNPILGGTGLDAVRAGLFGSLEFYEDAGGTTSGFVNLLYQRGLNRTPDPQGFTTFVLGVNGNDINSRIAGAYSLITSKEAETNEVNNFYTGILQRTGDSAGVAFWIQDLQSGINPINVEIGFIASTEFNNDAYAAVVTPFNPFATIDTR